MLIVDSVHSAREQPLTSISQLNMAFLQAGASA